MQNMLDSGLERKFCQLGEGLTVVDGTRIEGYASLFGAVDQGGDVVQPGAYAGSLERLAAGGRAVKLLWQHDPTQPIGIWDEVHEDARGLHVKGRLLTEVARGREAAALIEAGAIDGLSIGYRTVRSHKTDSGRRVLAEIDLWEVSLVTFPMLPDARIGAKADAAPDAPDQTLFRELAEVVEDARRRLACAD
ncbi:HK97 family phage prohead protease [Meridianimarinicoccus roseus]|uniref:HK97 family phage prohead protease n=1 Tax=Meridianimarinicoccus roseus TaxID=2072018 RepID=A0A2V2LHN9_9RHOB|nr:HK97 family phage prohead protease [Meridianimarinicoccus roseus]PWR03054.1 HK97 family phage prohead protease [Meridianimarinicoccus roseus]